MGHRSNPNILRLGLLRNWQHLWFAKDSYYKLLHQDLFIRRYVKALFRTFGFQILRVGIKRNIKSVFITVSVFNWNKKPSEILVPYLANIKWWFADNIFQVIAQRFNIAIYRLTGVVDIRLRLQLFRSQTSSVEKIIKFANPLLFAKYIIRNHRRMYSAKRSIKILKSSFKELPLNFSLIRGLRIQVAGPLKAPRQRRAQTYKYILAGPVPLQTFSVNTLYTVMSRVLSEGLVTTKIWMRRPVVDKPVAKRKFFVLVVKKFLRELVELKSIFFRRGRIKFWKLNEDKKISREFYYNYSLTDEYKAKLLAQLAKTRRY